MICDRKKEIICTLTSSNLKPECQDELSCGTSELVNKNIEISPDTIIVNIFSLSGIHSNVLHEPFYSASALTSHSTGCNQHLAAAFDANEILI